jgi:hypothetical protein
LRPGHAAGAEDPAEAELGTIGPSLSTYVKDNQATLQVSLPAKKVAKLAKKAGKAIKKVTRAKAGPKLDTAKTKANTALDALDAAVNPQA